MKNIYLALALGLLSSGAVFAADQDTQAMPCCKEHTCVQKTEEAVKSDAKPATTPETKRSSLREFGSRSRF